MEFVVEVLAEFIFWALNLTVGLGLAAVVYAIWVMVRRRLWGLHRAVVAETPDGARFTLVIPVLRIRAPLSGRIFRMRGGHDVPEPRWARNDRLHPLRLAESTDEMLIFVVPFLLVGVVLLAFVFVLEVILALVVLGLAATVAFVVRHRWTCVVSDPNGETWEVRSRGLRRIRGLRDDLAARIRAGDPAAIERIASGRTAS